MFHIAIAAPCDAFKCPENSVCTDTSTVTHNCTCNATLHLTYNETSNECESKYDSVLGFITNINMRVPTTVLF